MVSCDDIPFAQFMAPPLTTVRVPLAETGEARSPAAAADRGRAGPGTAPAAAGGADRPLWGGGSIVLEVVLSARTGETVTRIAIDPAALRRVDRHVFGGFVEHLGRCIYGGLYEEGSG